MRLSLDWSFFSSCRVDEAADATGRLDEIDPKACRANVEERFGVQVMAEGYEKVFRQVSALKASGPANSQGPGEGGSAVGA